MKIYLDDFRDAPTGWIRFISVSHLICELALRPEFFQEVTHASFDHDLAIEHYGIPQETWASNPRPDGLVHQTGYDACVAFISFAKKNNLPKVELTCHSANTAGKANIERLIHEYNQSFR